MNEKVCEARERAYDRLPYDVLCNIIDGRGTEPLPDDPTLIIPCPPLDAPHPGCGADAGEACREPLAPVRSVVRIDVNRFADAVRDATPALDVALVQDPATGEWRYDVTPSTVEPAVDVGELRAEIERLGGEVAYLRRREASIIAAVDPADGGQYRTDIVSAFQRVRRERDALRPSAEDVAHMRSVGASASFTRDWPSTAVLLLRLAGVKGGAS